MKQKDYVEQNTVALMLAGSHAYGTNIEGSDVDLRGVAIMPDKKYYMGFASHFEQFSESEPEDLTVYDIRKAMHLISNCNPNMIELVFTDERFYRKITPYWEMILEHKEKFLSKKARYTYSGYAFQQLKRIKVARKWLISPPKTKPERADFGLPNEKLISKQDLGAYHWILVNLLRESIDYLNFSDETKEELLSANFIGLVQRDGIPDAALDTIQKVTGASDEWMTMMRKEQAYANAKREWDAYQRWKNGRNKKRAVLEEQFGYDTKHASHLVRLMRMGKEILTTGQVHVFRPDHEELLGIRNGAWSYEQIEEYADTMQDEMAQAYESSVLPHSPDRPFLDNLCADVIDKYLVDNG